MYFILFVLHQPDLCNDILTAWEQAGVSGVTILPSYGLGRLRQQAGLREDLPIIPSLVDLFDRDEVQNRTLFTIVKDEGMVDHIVAATEAVTGDLNQPNTGILVVLPILRAYGLDRKKE